jgi:hypothetical protein
MYLAVNVKIATESLSVFLAHPNKQEEFAILLHCRAQPVGNNFFIEVHEN